MILSLSFLIYRRRWPDSIIPKIPANSQMQWCVCLDRDGPLGKMSLCRVHPKVSLRKRHWKSGRRYTQANGGSTLLKEHRCISFHAISIFHFLTIPEKDHMRTQEIESFQSHLSVWEDRHLHTGFLQSPGSCPREKASIHLVYHQFY